MNVLSTPYPILGPKDPKADKTELIVGQIQEGAGQLGRINMI